MLAHIKTKSNESLLPDIMYNSHKTLLLGKVPGNISQNEATDHVRSNYNVKKQDRSGIRGSVVTTFV